MKVERDIRVPLTIQQLILFEEDRIANYDLYVEKNTNGFNENMLVYLDDLIDVDDKTDEKIYPKFAINLGLEWYFSGKTVRDIIFNTNYQLKSAAIRYYIKNFNYYNEHDCFYTFDNE